MDQVKRIDGFVALIDVLGFRELVGREDELTAVGRYVDVVVQLLDEPARQLQFALFSDNLLINTYDATEKSLYRLITACSHVSYELAERRIAVRGAISYGRFLRSPNTGQGVILAGRPIVEANEYEHQQDWVGIMLSQSTVRDREELLRTKTTINRPAPAEPRDAWIMRNTWAMCLQPTSIPFHGGIEHGAEALEGFAIVPLRDGATSPNEIQESIDRTRGQYSKMKLGAPNPAAQRKFAAAERFLYSTYERWRMHWPY